MFRRQYRVVDWGYRFYVEARYYWFWIPSEWYTIGDGVETRAKAEYIMGHLAKRR